MRVPKKTILAVGLALVFAACAQRAGVDGDDRLSRKEFRDYRVDTLTKNMKQIITWTESTYHYLMRTDSLIDYLLEQIPREKLVRDSIPFDGDDPPLPPCRVPPCNW